MSLYLCAINHFHNNNNNAFFCIFVLHTGKGNFGEIFLASDNISIPVTNENAKFVVKIEPHSNGPLFVEIHCLMNTAKKDHHGKLDFMQEIIREKFNEKNLVN